MDKVIITLPCGFETTYDRLQNGKKIMRCMMCDEEDLVVEDVLNRPANRFRLKAKKLELDTENYEKLKSELLMIKQDPKFNVDKSFERIYNELELRREEIIKQVDKYYTNLRNDVEAKKQSTIKRQEHYLNIKIENIDFRIEKFLINDSNDLKTKLITIESNLQQIAQKTDELNKLISLSKMAESQKLNFSQVKIDMEQIFGKIHPVDSRLDFKKKYCFQIVQGFTIYCIENDGKTILGGSDDGKIRLWDINKFNCKCVYKDDDAVFAEVAILCMLKNYAFASCSSNNNLIKIWSLKSDNCVNTLRGHKNLVTGLKLLLNGQLASCSRDKTIKIWNYRTGKCIQTIDCQINDLNEIEEGPNNTIITAALDSTIRIWNTKSDDEIVKALNGHKRTIRSLKLLDSNKLASGSSDSTIKIWNLKTGECLNTLEGHSSCVYYLVLLKSGHLVSGCVDGTIKFWDFEFGECLKTIQAYEECLVGLLLTKNEEIITLSDESEIIVWSKEI